MKMKKIAAIALSIAMALSLTACGGTEKKETEAPKAETEAVKEETKEEAKEEAKEETAESETYTIGLTVRSTGDEIFTRIVDDCQKTCDEGGHTLLINDAGGDAANQLSAIENFITAGCDAIIVQAVDANAIHDALQKARSKGIKVVALFIGLNEGDYDAWYSNDEYAIGYAIGQMTGEWMNDNYEGKGKIGCIEYPQIPAIITRVEGMVKGLEDTAPEVEIAVTEAGVTADEGLNLTNNMLAAEPDIVAIMAFLDTPLLGAYQACAIAELDPEKFGLFGSDGDMVALSYIAEDSYYKGTVALNSKDFGTVACNLALDLAAGKEVENPTTIPGPVTIENVKDFIQ